MRWIIAVLLSLGLGAGSYFASTMWNDYLVMQAKLTQLRAEQKDLEQVKKQYDEQADAVAKANALWAHIQQVGLQPDHWVTHSLNVSKTLSWDDFTRLVLLSANTFDQEGGYWFKPAQLRVVRVTGDARSGKAKPEGPVQVEGTPKQVELYDATFTGEFLIRKQQPGDGRKP
jgi:hypothetical protein